MLIKSGEESLKRFRCVQESVVEILAEDTDVTATRSRVVGGWARM